MPFPASVLRAACAVQSDLKSAQAGFVPAQDGAVIGYVIGPGPHDVATVVSGVPINAQPGQTFNIRLEQEPTDPKLHWIVANQSLGAVLYTWRSGERTCHYLALATDDPSHRKDMEIAPITNARRKLALLLHYESGMEFAMLLRLARITTGHNLARLAIGLAIWLLSQHDDDLAAAQERADRLSLMNNKDRLAGLQGFTPANQFRTGNDLGLLCQGTKIILDSAKQAGTTTPAS